MSKRTTISFTETSNIKITDFSDYYKKRHPEYMELLNTDDFVKITGEAWRISVEVPHDCNCEYCDEKEDYSIDVENESDIDKKIEALMYEYDIKDKDEFEVDKIFCVKGVRQNHDIEGLFK